MNESGQKEFNCIKDKITRKKETELIIIFYAGKKTLLEIFYKILFLFLMTIENQKQISTIIKVALLQSVNLEQVQGLQRQSY